MPLYGDITTFSLAAVCRMIHAEKKTGVLKVKSGEQDTSIYFEKGIIVFINCDLTEDLLLGSVFKDHDLVSDDNIMKSYEIARETGKRIPAILIEQGYISQKNLTGVLHDQFKEAITRVLIRGDGDFTYSDGTGDHLEDIHMKIDPIRLIAEAQKWTEYRNLIPNDQVVFQIKEGALQSNASSGEGIPRVILLINGKRTVSRIIAETDLPRLAVYKALTTLFLKGIITRQGMEDITGEPDQPGHESIIQFYINLLHEMTALLAMELGSKKASYVLQKSVKHSLYHERFLCAFHPDADVKTNSYKIYNHIQRQREKLLPEDLMKGFNDAVISLLKAEYQMLGFKATQNTIDQATAVLERVPGDQKNLAGAMIRFMEKYRNNEDLFRQTKSTSETMVLDHKLTAGESKPQPHSPGNVGGAAIIAFYSGVFKMVIRDLEKEIGTKAQDLFRNIVKNSEYHDLFLSHFEIENTISTNVKRIQEHIMNQAHKPDRQGLVLAFQQVLMVLLTEENRLLGDKATRKSITSIEDHIAENTSLQYRQMTDTLLSALKNRGYSGK